MNKIKILHAFIAITIFASLFNTVSYANNTVDFNEIYLEYAKEADKNYKNKLNDAISGLILIDLNRDKVPELLAFSTTVSCFDEEGNLVYAFDKGYDNPAYKEYSYGIERAFSIIEGEIVEDSPWRHAMYNDVVSMPFLPDEDETDTEEFCTTFQYRGREDYLIMYEISDWGSVFSALWYDDEGFGFSHEGFDDDFFNLYSLIDLPVSSVRFYDDKRQQKLTYSEAMEILLNKYKNAVNNSTYSNSNTEENNVSDWAVDEVNEAKKLNLIPQEMLNDNLTENITRAEFAAIAVQLHQAILGRELNRHGGYIIDIDDNIYEKYIRAAYNLGITNGTGKKDGGVIFSPDLTITREQLATMLCRVVKMNKFEDWFLEDDSDFHLDISNTKRFSDDYQISDYANESVYYMGKHDIIKGLDNDRFAPLATATKEQAILLALRIYNAFDELPVLNKQEENVSVNENVLNMIGKTYKEIQNYWGKADGAIWDMGVAFSFDNGKMFYCFVNENNQTAREPHQTAICHAGRCDLNVCIDGLVDKTYSKKELENLIGFPISYDGQSEMDECHCYSFKYNNADVTIYADEKDNIYYNADVLIKSIDDYR